MDNFKGMRILFKVEKSSAPSIMFDGTYRVKRVCKDSPTIKAFFVDGVHYTPTIVLGV